MARRLLLIILTVVILAGAGAAGGWFWFKDRISRAGPSNADRVVLIPPGSGINKIADILVAEGLLTSALHFKLAARLEKRDRGLRPGELKFPARASVLGLLDVLRKGEAVARTVTIPEGLTAVEALAVVARAEGLQGPMPALPGEGRVLPETYRYQYYDKKTDLIRRMEKAMDDALAAAWAKRAKGLPIKSPEEALVLASIVEKETGVAAERPRVAAVFINRLNKGMKLQSDPTVTYGITMGKAPLGRDLTRKDLDTPTAYNTYTNDGLPPDPIANPGRAAIDAVLNPIQSKELFFVADGSGGHAFAETLADHNRNVARWRKLQGR
ncbi:MAG: endolytic transglycosylase MltG [Rhodospirillaceae bacterium]